MEPESDFSSRVKSPNTTRRKVRSQVGTRLPYLLCSLSIACVGSGGNQRGSVCSLVGIGERAVRVVSRRTLSCPVANSNFSPNAVRQATAALCYGHFVLADLLACWNRLVKREENGSPLTTQDTVRLPVTPPAFRSSAEICAYAKLTSSDDWRTRDKFRKTGSPFVRISCCLRRPLAIKMPSSHSATTTKQVTISSANGRKLAPKPLRCLR